MTKTNFAAIRLALPLLAVIPAYALAQANKPAEGPPAERINQVIVYGDDPCPKGDGGDIVVCVRKEDKERYRIPPNLRSDPNSPASQSWLNTAKSIEYVGQSGIQSCSPVGSGGASGCFAKLARMAKAEREQEGNGGWADLVAAERAKRLSKIDAESEEIENQVKAEEAADVAANSSNSTAQPPQ